MDDTRHRCAIALLLADPRPGAAQFPPTGGKGTPAKDSPQKDLEALKKVFGLNQVTVSLLNQPQSVSGTIADVVDLFGRRFLQITDNSGRQHLLNPELITAIRQQ